MRRLLLCLLLCACATTVAMPPAPGLAPIPYPKLKGEPAWIRDEDGKIKALMLDAENVMILAAQIQIAEKARGVAYTQGRDEGEAALKEANRRIRFLSGALPWAIAGALAGGLLAGVMIGGK